MRHNRGKQAGCLVADLGKSSRYRDNHVVQAGREPGVARLGLLSHLAGLVQPEVSAAACVDALLGLD